MLLLKGVKLSLRDVIPLAETLTQLKVLTPTTGTEILPSAKVGSSLWNILTRQELFCHLQIVLAPLPLPPLPCEQIMIAISLIMNHVASWGRFFCQFILLLKSLGFWSSDTPEVSPPFMQSLSLVHGNITWLQSIGKNLIDISITGHHLRVETQLYWRKIQELGSVLHKALNNCEFIFTHLFLDQDRRKTEE